MAADGADATAGRVRRIGLLIAGDETDPVAKARISAFTKALGDLGWTDGSNVRMDLRWGGSDTYRIRALAQEVVALAILTHTTVHQSRLPF